MTLELKRALDRFGKHPKAWFARHALQAEWERLGGTIATFKNQPVAQARLRKARGAIKTAQSLLRSASKVPARARRR